MFLLEKQFIENWRFRANSWWNFHIQYNALNRKTNVGFVFNDQITLKWQFIKKGVYTMMNNTKISFSPMHRIKVALLFCSIFWKTCWLWCSLEVMVKCAIRYQKHFINWWSDWSKRIFGRTETNCSRICLDETFLIRSDWRLWESNKHQWASINKCSIQNLKALEQELKPRIKLLSSSLPTRTIELDAFRFSELT